jgi:ABC-type phosphate transport system permease subunit
MHVRTSRVPYLVKPISAIVFGVLFLATAADMMSRNEHVSAFPAVFAAIFLMYFTIIAPAVAGGVVGVWLARRTDRAWLGWIAALAVFLMLGTALHIGVRAIPGIGWRIESMQGGSSN